MSEELLQRNLINHPEKIGKWDFYNIGATNLKSLKENGILKKVHYPKYDLRKPDGIIVHKGETIALISNKLPKKLNKDKEVTDWVDVTKTLGSKLLIVTDAKTKTHWVNALTGKIIKDEKGDELKILFYPSNDEVPKLIERILESIDEKSNQLNPIILSNPTQLAKSVWQDIWSVSKGEPESCLYTFVELFIFKYLSDLNVLTGTFHFNELLKKYEKDTPEQVLDEYVTRIRKEIKKQFKENSEDKTTIINGSTFVNKQGDSVSGLSTVFKKVLFKFREYEKTYGKFNHIDYEFKSKIFETFLKESETTKKWGQHFTPLKVVRAIVKMARSDVRDGITICDPACGVGKFLLEVIAENPNRFYAFTKNKLNRKLNLIGYDVGFEDREQKTIILAKANMLIYLSELIRENSKDCEEFSKLFNDTFKLHTKTILGTLFYPEDNKYELILTNPPYVSSGTSNLKEEIKISGLEQHYTINSLGIEGLFMQWIVKALKEDGKAFVVVPDNLLLRPTDNKLRKFISDNCIVDGIISLPSKTFFNTVQKTSILIITKKPVGVPPQKEPVFTYLVTNIGEKLDKNRFDTEENDLETAANLFNQFKGDKKHFTTKDKRCKIKDAGNFTVEGTNWVVDKWWSQEEKIELGIIQADKRVNPQEFSDILKDIVKNISMHQNTIKMLEEKKSGKTIFKDIEIKKIFDYVSGDSKYTQVYINNNSGEYPVYSSNTKQNGLLGNINSYDHDIECLQLTTNGVYAGTFFYRHRHKFSINGDAKLLVKKDQDIDYQYFLFELKSVFKQYQFNWQNKPSQSKIENIKIKVPVLSNGKFDLNKQKQMAEKSQIIEDIKLQVTIEMEKALKIQVSFEN